jgi:hypothetical protein
MAEMVLKVGAGSNYEDGDIICAFNKRDIECVHAQKICHYNKAALTADGLRADGLEIAYLDTVYQYRFTRVSETEALRTETDYLGNVIGTPELIGPPEIDVALYLRRRKAHQYKGVAKHRIFGTPGAEIWHGGKTDVSQEAVTKVWEQIEGSTPHRLADPNCKLYPLGRQDVRSHLPLSIDEFTAEEGQALISPQYEVDGNDDLVWHDQDSEDTAVGATPPDDGRQWELKVISKRNLNADWVADAVPLLPVNANMIRDRRIAVDYRGKIPPIGEGERVKLTDKRRGGKVPPKIS